MSKRKKGNRKGNRGGVALAAQPSEPASGRRHAIGFVGKAAGVKVTEHNALTLAPVWACVRVITDALSTLPLKTYRRVGGNRVEAADDPVDWLLQVQANEETPAFFWREAMLGWSLIWGNGYSEIERDGAGRPVWLHQLAPDRVMPDRTSRGRLIYDVANPRQPNTVLDAADTLHLHGFGFDGLCGYSIAAMLPKAIGLGLALEEYACSFFANDATPGGALKHPRKLTEAAFQHLRETFEGRHRGPSKGNRMAILEEGMEFTPFAVPNDKAQFLESRNALIPEICRIFKVPPHKVMDLLRATFSNIEEQEIEFVVDCLHPWAARLEAECNIKLFGRNNRGTLFVQHDFTGRLRGNVAARGVFNHQMLGDGVFSINDVLIREGLNPIGPIGDQRFIPLNMQPLDKAGEPKPAPGASGVPPAKTPAPKKPSSDAPPDDPSPPELRREREQKTDIVKFLFGPIFDEAVGRAMSRARHRVEEARKRLSGPALSEWYDRFTVDQKDYLARALGPAATSLAIFHGGEGRIGPESAGDYASCYVDSLAAQIRSGAELPSDPGQFVAEVMGYIADITKGKNP